MSCAGGDMLHRGRNEPVGAWMPGIIGLGRRRHGDQAGGAPGDDDVGVARPI